METKIPYLDKKNVFYKDTEIGPVNHEDLLRIIYEAPLPKEGVTGCWDLVLALKKSEGYESKAKACYDIEKNSLSFNELQFHGNSLSKKLIHGLRVNKLFLSFPKFSSFGKDFFNMGKALTILRENIQEYLNAGYLIDDNFLKINYHLFSMGNTGFYSTGYGSKIALRTEPLIKDKPEKKLILQISSDVSESQEAVALMNLVKKIDKSKK